MERKRFAKSSKCAITGKKRKTLFEGETAL